MTSRRTCPSVDPLGTVLKGTVIGLIAVIALGALFITAEYRRGLIRTTFTASPRRGRVLAAKAIVIGAVTFVAGLVGAAVAVPIAERKLRSGGWVSSVYPVWSLTSAHGLQIVVGTAGAARQWPRSWPCPPARCCAAAPGAITAVVVLVVVPVILAIILPQAPADWLLRLTPAAAFSVQQGMPQYSQVMQLCMPYNGCFPLAPWTGFAVLCAWAAVALGLADLPAAPEGRMNGGLPARPDAAGIVHAEWTKLRTTAGTGWLLLTPSSC